MNKAVLPLIIFLIVAISGVAYFFVMSSTQSTSSTIARVSSTTTAQGIVIVASTSNVLSGGYQDATGQPQGTWTKYLGLLPPGYQPAPKGPNSNTWPCPPGLVGAACTQFQATCGNGVCDPNERCDTCPIDCGGTGSLTCDPFTGRQGSPAAICQVMVQQQANP